MEYNIENIYKKIETDWRNWAEETNAKNFIIGMSGGKDSAVVAALAVKIFGKDRVIGLKMPQGIQNDINYAIGIIGALGIKSYTINIKDICDSTMLALYNDLSIPISIDTQINMPARIRMTVLFAAAQSLNARVINTGNLSEDMVGYSTLFGDMAGVYSPLMELTATEVIELGRFLGIPSDYLVKPPSDGLCGLTDEDKLGFTYKDLDNFIRLNEGTDEFKDKIRGIYKRNKFKLELINFPHPKLDLPNYIINTIDD